MRKATWPPVKCARCAEDTWLADARGLCPECVVAIDPARAVLLRAVLDVRPEVLADGFTGATGEG